MTEDEMVGWHHQLDGHEFNRAPGAGEGQGSLASCSPWGLKGLDTTEQLNTSNKIPGDLLSLLLKEVCPRINGFQTLF